MARLKRGCKLRTLKPKSSSHHQKTSFLKYWSNHSSLFIISKCNIVIVNKVDCSIWKKAQIKKFPCKRNPCQTFNKNLWQCGIQCYFFERHCVQCPFLQMHFIFSVVVPEPLVLDELLIQIGRDPPAHLVPNNNNSLRGRRRSPLQQLPLAMGHRRLPPNQGVWRGQRPRGQHLLLMVLLRRCPLRRPRIQMVSTPIKMATLPMLLWQQFLLKLLVKNQIKLGLSR